MYSDWKLVREYLKTDFETWKLTDEYILTLIKLNNLLAEQNCRKYIAEFYAKFAEELK